MPAGRLAVCRHERLLRGNDVHERHLSRAGDVPAARRHDLSGGYRLLHRTSLCARPDDSAVLSARRERVHRVDTVLRTSEVRTEHYDGVHVPRGRRDVRGHQRLLHRHGVRVRHVSIPDDLPCRRQHDLHDVHPVLWSVAVSHVVEHRRATMLHAGDIVVPDLGRMLRHDELRGRTMPVPPARFRVPADSRLLQWYVHR